MHGLPDHPPASTRSRAQSYWGLSSPAIGRHLSKGSLLAFSSAYLQSYVVVNMNGGFRFGFCRPASEHRSPVWAGFRTEGLPLPSLSPSSRRTSALVAPAGPEPSPVEPTCPCSPALTSPREAAGSCLVAAGRWPRGLLEGACSGSCWVPACPPQTGPWGGGRAAVDLELDVGSDPQNYTRTQDRGWLHGAGLRLELTRAAACVSVCCQVCPPPHPHPPAVTDSSFDPPLSHICNDFNPLL